MHMFLDVILSLLGVTLVLSDRAPYEIDENGVRIVQVQRFNGDLSECRTGEVCADIFNFTRTLDDGTSQRESRFIQNCNCPSTLPPCGSQAADPLIFRETLTQSMMTCEPRQSFPVCEGDEIAKEQHNLGHFVYYRINCVCPDNENPRDFFNKMTVRTYIPGVGGPRTRLFKCRNSY